MILDRLLRLLDAYAQHLLDYDIALSAIDRSHLLIAIVMPLLFIGLTRVGPWKSITKIVLVASGVTLGSTYVCVELFVGRMGPACCIIHSDTDWQSILISGWLATPIMLFLTILTSFSMAKLSDNSTTRALLNISGWGMIVVAFSMRFFFNQTYINGALVIAAELVAAVAIACIILKTLFANNSTKRDMKAEGNEKADISTAVHHDDL